MTVNQHDSGSEAKQSGRQRLETVVRGHVLDLLGQTVGHYVRVRHLWAGKYRVNVFVGEATTFAQIAQSFFVSADDDGNILASTPAIRSHG